MAREYEEMRESVAVIREMAPDIEIFGVKDVMKVVKRSRNYVKRNIMPDTNSIYIVELARRLCKISRGQKIR